MAITPYSINPKIGGIRWDSGGLIPQLTCMGINSWGINHPSFFLEGIDRTGPRVLAKFSLPNWPSCLTSSVAEIGQVGNELDAEHYH